MLICTSYGLLCTQSFRNNSKWKFRKRNSDVTSKEEGMAWQVTFIQTNTARGIYGNLSWSGEKWKLIPLGIESTFLLMIDWILTAAMLIDDLHKEQQHVLTLKWWSCYSKKDLFNSSSFYLFFFPKSSKEFGSAFELSKETTKIKTNSYQKRTDNNKNKN
jgi:hypothetical protein